MNLSDFDYHLPKERIAQHPAEERDQSKLLVVDRTTGAIGHHRFFELPELLDGNSVLVFNESRVIPARINFSLGNGNAEILLIKPIENDAWECMVRPGKKFEPKTDGQIDPECGFHVKEVTPHGLRVIKFKCGDFNGWLKKHGQTPLPPYIKQAVEDSEKYQTIYSKTEGSVAAPTAGLHFTDRVFDGLKRHGIQTEFITLHVGLGTFQPVKTDEIEHHRMHSEWFSLSPETADRLNTAKAEGRKIIAVGTTTVRVLESCAEASASGSASPSAGRARLVPRSGETDIFIYPGYQWKFVDQLITNFHVPKSTLLMLVSSFADGNRDPEIPPKSESGRDLILRAYREALDRDYRFFSFGDSMWIR
jgi:S-adenosylmethionine:tRNA ribosyltransferase-isomerase